MHGHSEAVQNTTEVQLKVMTNFSPTDSISENYVRIFVPNENIISLKSFGSNSGVSRQEIHSDSHDLFIDWQEILGLPDANDGKPRQSVLNKEALSTRVHFGDTKSPFGEPSTFNGGSIADMTFSYDAAQSENASQRKTTSQNQFSADLTQREGASQRGITSQNDIQISVRDHLMEPWDIQNTPTTHGDEHDNSNGEQSYTDIQDKSLTPLSGINDLETYLDHTSFDSPLLQSFLDPTQDNHHMQNTIDTQTDIGIQDNGENPPSYKDPFPYSCESENVQTQIRVFLMRVHLLSIGIAFRVSTGSYLFFVRLAMDFKS